MSNYSSIYQPVVCFLFYLSVFISLYLSIYLFISLSTYLSTSNFPSISISQSPRKIPVSPDAEKTHNAIVDRRDINFNDETADLLPRPSACCRANPRCSDDGKATKGEKVEIYQNPKIKIQERCTLLLSLYRDDCKGRRLTRLYATQGMKSVFSVAKSRAEVMRERERGHRQNAVKCNGGLFSQLNGRLN